MRSCGHCGADISHRNARAKSCSQACNMALWRARNPEKAREDAKASMQKYRDTRPAEARAAGARRRRDPGYREAMRQRSAEWRKKNRHRASEARHRRRIRLREHGVFEFTERDWNRLVARYRGCCAYCGEKCGRLQREHVIPVSRGGRHSAGNILPACQSCNSSKKAKLLSEWRLEQQRR